MSARALFTHLVKLMQPARPVIDHRDKARNPVFVRMTTTMRLFTAILSLFIAVILLACGLFDSSQKTAKSGDEAAMSETPPGIVTPSAGSTVRYNGPASLEERIFAAPVIARVRLSSATSTIESATSFDGSTKYVALMEFNFSVQEYLKGSGSSDIVALWESRPVFDTLQEAEAALPMAAARDTQWDDHEAVVFLQHSQTYLTSTHQEGRYYLTWNHEDDIFDDKYSIASRRNKLWLPAEVAIGSESQTSGDQQRFLMDVPPATGSAPTITLGEIKTRIAAVTANLAAGDGTKEYAECVQRTYLYEREDRYDIDTGGDGLNIATPDQELNSGLAASTVVYETIAYGGLQNERAEVWLDGGDASLFSVEFSAGVPYNFSGDGTIDSTQYIQRVESARPLPAGVYRTHYNNRDAVFVPCEGYTTRHEWTVTVTAPKGVLHEAFFDPVTDGSAVAADSSNGVLEPASFIDAGATTTLERIEWEAGTAMVKLTPHTALAGRVVDFIELDGKVSLSLVVDAATVDTANNTLSWSVSPQPWDDGDKLMLRIREVLSTCTNGVVVPNHATNPDLVADCSVLLAARDMLRGTPSLDWNATSTISTWEGIGLNATSTRVTALALDGAGLNGVIPPALGDLSALETLDLRDNELTGEIPAELGSLANLQTLRLSGNSFTGCIPPTLADVTTNDLASLNIQYCQAPAPSGVSASLSDGTFSIGWTAMSGVDQYEVQYQTDDPNDDWAALGTATTTTLTHTPVDGPMCGTTYRFRVRAYGDGTQYQASWGPESAPEEVTTAECDRAPRFGSTHYSFSIAENAATSTSVGTVTATDEDGDPVTYETANGSPDGKFGIAEMLGVLARDMDRFKDWSNDVALTVEPTVSDRQTVRIRRSGQELRDYFDGIIEQS